MKIKSIAMGLLLSSSLVNAQPVNIDVTETTKPVAKQIAQHIQSLSKELLNQIRHKSHSIPFSVLHESKMGQAGFKNHSLQQSWKHAELSLIESKGLTNYTPKLLELRLANPDSLEQWKSGKLPLVAYVPKGNESSWTEVEAFDAQGRTHYLDPYVLPEYPVLVLDIDAQTDLKAGVQLMNDALKQANVLPYAAQSSLVRYKRADVPKSQKFTKLDRIYISDDNEPWVKGSAELYAIVSGIDAGEAKPLMSVVDMPYLTEGEQEYRPNQTVIAWGQYRFNAANLMIFEQDGNYNYKELVSHLIKATASILTMAGQPEIASLVSLGNAIVSAMPDSWYEDSDDFVDAYYTLERGKVYLDYPGAANNATASFSPFNVQE